MGFEYLDHRADLAVRAWGATLDEAFGEAARALFAAMAAVECVAPRAERSFALRAPSLELLLVDWLAALVAEKDVSGFVFSRFAANVTADGRGATLRGAAWGEPLDPARHDPRAEVKGISLLGLRVSFEDGAWTIAYVADT